MAESPRVSIVDYGMCNMFSVQRACLHAGLTARLTAAKDEILGADALILPGVGAFGSAMQSLEHLDLVGPIKDFVASGRPFMGICLGMQLLLTRSEEFGEHKGLDLIPGRVRRFPDRDKVPQVGWNRIYRPAGLPSRAWANSPLCDIPENSHMYFVHSFYAAPDDPGAILSLTEYAGQKYCSSILAGNVFACQFHPEKSALDGLKIYGSWAAGIVAARSRRS